MTIEGITLPNPDWGDAKAIVSKVHYHRTMSGDSYSYTHAPSNINWRKVSYSFSNVLYDVYLTLVMALNAAAGGTITVVDHDSVTWTGIQTSNPVSMTWDNRGIVCVGYATEELNERGSFTFEFEGYHA